MPTTAARALGIPGLLARLLIRVYRYTLSSVVGRTCRHLPTCSEFAEDAIDRFGLWAGGWMALARISRCRPFGSHGFDPVPATLPQASRWYLPWRYGKWRSGADTSTTDVPSANMRSRFERRLTMSKVKPALEHEPEEFRFKQPGEDPEYDAWFKEQVQIGIDEADRGETIPHEEVEREWQKMRAELLRRIEEQK